MSKKKITQAQLRQIIQEEIVQIARRGAPRPEDLDAAVERARKPHVGRAALQFPNLFGFTKKPVKKPVNKKDHKTITQLTKSTEGSPPKPPVKKPVYKKGTGGDFDEKPDDKPLVRVDKGPGKGIVTGEETVGGNIAYSSRERPGTMSGGKKSPMTNVGHTPVEPKNLDQIQQGVKGYPKSQQEHKEWSSYEGDQKLFENWRKFTGESK